MKLKKLNKKGGMSDIFIFMIVAIIIVFISAIFIYMAGIIVPQLKESLNNTHFEKANVTQIIDNSMGKLNNAYQSLYWISVFLIVGMAISIFIGSYLVTTSPVYFVPYTIVTIIAIIVSVGLSNAYEMVIQDPTLASTFAGFVGANFILSKLPIWVTVIGIVGGVIMFVRMGSRENMYGGGVYG